MNTPQILTPLSQEKLDKIYADVLLIEKKAVINLYMKQLDFKDLN